MCWVLVGSLWLGFLGSCRELRILWPIRFFCCVVSDLMMLTLSHFSLCIVIFWCVVVSLFAAVGSCFGGFFPFSCLECVRVIDAFSLAIDALEVLQIICLLHVVHSTVKVQLVLSNLSCCVV